MNKPTPDEHPYRPLFMQPSGCYPEGHVFVFGKPRCRCGELAASTLCLEPPARSR